MGVEWPDISNPDNLDAWPSKQEVMDRLKLSEKTIERRITENVLRSQTRPIPGGKPLPILHPVDVRELAKTVLAPIPMQANEVTKKPPASWYRQRRQISSVS